MRPLDLATRRRLTLAATILGSSLAFVDATVVVVAMPTIERDLDLGLTGEQWLFLAYSLALAALYLPAGAVGDRYGRRSVFTIGIAGFAAASALAGAAPDEGVLIAARALQGVAGAFLTTNSLALLRAVYADEAGRAIGLWTSFTSVATIAGPPVGGAFVEWVSWRWIFFLNLPFAIAAVLLARVGRCDERRTERIGRLDVPGAALTATALAFLTWGLVEGAENGFGTVWWTFVVAAVAASAFGVVERRVAEPMLPFRLFRERNFAAANAETFLVYAALYGYLVYSTLFLQFLGFTPFQAGLLSIPTSAIMILLAARFGAIADRRGPRLLLTAGPTLVGCGVLLWLPISSRTGFWSFGFPGLVVFGVGLAMLVAPITSTALRSAPPELAGVASGVNSTLSRVGSLTAVAVVGLVVQLVFASQADHGVPLARGQDDPVLRAASVDGFRAGILLVAGLAFVGALVAALGISDDDARGQRTGTGASRKASRLARSRQRATASARVSPKP